MRTRKNNKLLNLTKILNSAESTKGELTELSNKIGIDPVIVWQKDYNPSFDEQGCIINLGNPEYLSGTHWCATYKDKYFDSFGLPPPLIVKNKTYSNTQIQNPNGGKCGLFCVLWLWYAKKNKIDEFYKEFTS